MTKLILIVLGLVIAIGVVVLWQAQRYWNEKTDDLQRRLAAAVPKGVTYSEAELVGLPAPVARYFRKALKPGQPIIKRARVTWKGEFNMGEPGKDNWKPFTAVQDFVPSAPGFVWDARIAMAPGVNALVRDGFVDGAGSMLAKVMGLITVADSHDKPALAIAALQRYLGEAVWFPTALLPSQGVKWESINEARARATISGGGVTTSLEFRFGADDLIASAYASERVFDDGKSPPTPLPWQAHNLSYGEFNGVKVPVESTVEWLFPDGAYAYWRGRPSKIEYEYATAPAMSQ